MFCCYCSTTTQVDWELLWARIGLSWRFAVGLQNYQASYDEKISQSLQHLVLSQIYFWGQLSPQVMIVSYLLRSSVKLSVTVTRSSFAAHKPLLLLHVLSSFRCWVALYLVVGILVRVCPVKPTARAVPWLE